MATSTPKQDAIASSLAQDRPTIDAAIKSFLSLYTARNLTQGNNSTTQQEEALQQARVLLKTINQYTFPLQPEPSDEYKVTSRIWNGLIASNQKPSKFLGRTSLQLAWNHGLVDEFPKQSDFLKEFEHLLLSYNPESPPTTLDSDACLVWDADNGAAELSRRRSRRAERAQQVQDDQQQQQQQQSSLTIEELPEDNEETKGEEGTTATEPTIEHVDEADGAKPTADKE